MPTQNSIFEFADEFGYSSPFGDWLPKKQENYQFPKIKKVSITRGHIKKVPANPKTMRAAHELVPIWVIVDMDLPANKVEVEINKSKWTAFSFGYGTYKADILLPSSGIYGDVYILKIIAYDVNNQVSDMAVYNVTVREGKVQDIISLDRLDKDEIEEFTIDSRQDITGSDLKRIVVFLRKMEKTGKTQTVVDKNNTKNYKLGEPILDTQGNRIEKELSQFFELQDRIFTLKTTERIK